ncbi:MAG TPA: 2-dehydropantoate 2-reductase [Cytophagales bacterium]|nr:2-dehydropantoate 2-reductase [Cytophagales bacterium]HAA21658.1 2-dehydropantoate 2-reductase [Cytophagales bacterium]HAP63719.1 2-dehydropantoate 2-reductase [Cytophagales bacterium]
MKIAIIGTGGVGGYFGGRLAQAGHSVAFLARGQHLEVMRAQGLTVKSVNGDFHLPQVQATDTIAEIGSVDLVMLGLKAWQVKELAPQLSNLLHDNTLVLPMQNGVTSAEDLQPAVPKAHILAGLCRIISKVEAPGVINHFGFPPTITFAEYDSSPSERTQQVKTILETAQGIKAEIPKDIQVELWKKYLFICLSGLQAVTRVTFDALRKTPESRALLLGLFQEIQSVGQAKGVALADDLAERTLAFVDTLQADGTTSMARDIWDGRPSEIHELNGAVVKMADPLGIDVPINRFVYHSLLPLEGLARG